jgi:chromosome segregation ATPase
MVRASDLEQIRPIVDPSAAITDAVRKVDIPSIPRVQERLLAEQQAALQAQQEALLALLEQHRRDVFASFEQRAVEQAQIVTTLSARVARIEECLEQVAAGAEARPTMLPDYQARHEAQDRVIEALTGQLQEEVEARQALSARLVTLEGQYQELRRTVESLAKRRKRSSAAQ